MKKDLGESERELFLRRVRSRNVRGVPIAERGWYNWATEKQLATIKRISKRRRPPLKVRLNLFLKDKLGA